MHTQAKLCGLGLALILLALNLGPLADRSARAAAVNGSNSIVMIFRVLGKTGTPSQAPLLMILKLFNDGAAPGNVEINFLQRQLNDVQKWAAYETPTLEEDVPAAIGSKEGLVLFAFEMKSAGRFNGVLRAVDGLVLAINDSQICTGLFRIDKEIIPSWEPVARGIPAIREVNGHVFQGLDLEKILSRVGIVVPDAKSVITQLFEIIVKLKKEIGAAEIPTAATDALKNVAAAKIVLEC